MIETICFYSSVIYGDRDGRVLHPLDAKAAKMLRNSEVTYAGEYDAIRNRKG